MVLFAHALIAVFMFVTAFMPGQLKFGRGMPGRRGPYLPTTPGREKIIRAVAFIIGSLIWIDVISRLTGRGPFLH
jgi:hypothetical protein